jgi:amino acid transporter
MASLKRFLIGRPMKSDELGEQKLSKLKGLAILSSDALSSVAYGTEQILIVLATIGVASFWYSIPIALCILILLFALILSYRQIIFAYPNGGGAYMVSKENMGVNFGLVAGGSLLVDYILTVAVSVSAGADALTSAFPGMHDYTVAIAVFFVVIITIMNLRGLTESATILMFPVYLFVICFIIMLIVGLYRVVTGDIPYTLQTDFGAPVAGISLFILLKAFASGTSALTGVEAISNAIPNFKDPAPKNAAKTLVIMGGMLATLFVGITFLSYYYGVGPKEKETIVSQIASITFGRNIMYYLIQGTTTVILILAANTGFSAFPQLAFNLAKDGFIPRKFTVRGDRLGYSNGIIVLGIASIVLIYLFNGKTEQLIPLYAVGVFIPFTLSQTGMTIKWFKEKSNGWIPKMLTNLFGAIISFIVLSIFFITKFEKVWFVLVFLPVIVYFFHQIKKHYDSVAVQLRINPEERISPYEGNVIVVPVAGITKVVEKSVNYAKSITDQVYAVYVAFDREEEKRFEEKWKKYYPDVRLVTLQSKYRSLVTPLMKFISTIENKAEDTNYQVTVLIPQFVTKRTWHHFLHNQSSLLIRAYLIFKKDVIVTTVPYHFNE